MKNYMVEPLSRATLSQAYPLLRLTMPGLDMLAWKKFARLAVDPRRSHRAGILVARRVGRQYICGLVSYRFDNELSFGRILVAENLAVADLLDTQPIILALVEVLGALGRARGCSAIHLRAPNTEPLASALAEAVTLGNANSSINHMLDVSFIAPHQPAADQVHGI